MISNQILQNTIDGLKNITRIDLCIIDTEGKILATTFAEADRYVSPAMALVELSGGQPGSIRMSFSLKYLMNINWNMCCLQMETAMMSI